MEILIFNIILVIFEAAIVPKNKIGRNLYLIIVFVQLFIVHAFLDPFSMVDLPGYYEAYEMFGSNSLRDSILWGYSGVKMEPGWICLCKALYAISSNPRVLLIVTSTLMVGAYCKTVSVYSSSAWLSIFLYLCTTYGQSLFVLRQHSAIALSLLSIPFILNRDFIKFTMIMAIAISFHYTAIIFFPMYFLYNINLKHYWSYLILFSIIGGIIGKSLFFWLFTNTWYSSYEDKDGSNYTMFAIALCSLVLYLISIKWKVKNLEGAEKFFLIMGSVAVLISLIGVGFSPTNRLVKYYSVSSIIIIPMAINHFNDIKAKTLIVFFVIFFYALLFMAPSNSMYIENYQIVGF